MFTVVWSGAVLADMSRIWDSSPRLHPHLLAARAAIDFHLEADPFRLSEGRELDTRRVMFAYPIGILFTVDPDNKTVLVLAAWAYKLPT
ncbi:MAG: hypothetical protein ACRC33_26220 [Gemmataceae bacterium]